jgi:hypothetical protein
MKTGCLNIDKGSTINDVGGSMNFVIRILILKKRDNGYGHKVCDVINERPANVNIRIMKRLSNLFPDNYPKAQKNMLSIY